MGEGLRVAPTEMGRYDKCVDKCGGVLGVSYRRSGPPRPRMQGGTIMCEGLRVAPTEMRVYDNQGTPRGEVE